ncbi:MAG: PCRF domain-containing protein, partial [Acidobacteria bacterium]|nr:PCRF domain-containing protein [Acidobacteriota bacterium]
MQQLSKLEKELAEPGIWNDRERSQKLMRTRHSLEQEIETQTRLEGKLSDLDAYFELAREGEDVGAELER